MLKYFLFFSHCFICLLSDSAGKYMFTRSFLLWIRLSRSHQIADSWFPHTALCYRPGNKCFFTVPVCVGCGEKGLGTLHESGSRLAFIWWMLSSLANCSSPGFSVFLHVELHFLKAVFIGSFQKILFCFYFHNTTCLPSALSAVCKFFATASQILVYVAFLNWERFEMQTVNTKGKTFLLEKLRLACIKLVDRFWFL